MTHELILHHYATSPFSEKVRLVLGYKGLDWRSVVVPMINPKPDVVALTGGYRRTPFLQIGADIYCDSALMCRVLDKIRPEPPLYPHTSRGLDEIVAQWADASLFWAAVPHAMRSGGGPFIMAKAEPEQDDGRPLPERLKAFAADRAAMMGGAKVAGASDLKAQLQAYLVRLDALLDDGRPFLLGALASIADFSAAQSIWFLRHAPVVAEVLAPHPNVIAWYERIEAIGHGTSAPMTSGDALQVAASARAHAPTAFDATQGFAPEEEVAISALDYASDPIVGRLVGITRDETVIARQDERAGAVHVHFPRVGFQIRKHAPQS
jgi:glutathione S-transferase